MNPSFYKNIAEEVRRAESTLQVWSHEEMIDLFHEKVFCGIGQKGLQNYMQRTFAGKDKAAREAEAEDFVESVIYRFLATADAGVDADAARALARKANLDDVLQNKVLGGRPSWTIEKFISHEVWESCGEQAGMREVSIKFMTLVACKARDTPLNPLCPDCKEMRCVHKGDRTNVQMIACKCDTKDVAPEEASKRKTGAEPETASKVPKRTRGFKL
eukprot:673159-Prymnesium_polylepis.1